MTYDQIEKLFRRANGDPARFFEFGRRITRRAAREKSRKFFSLYALANACFEQRLLIVHLRCGEREQAICHANRVGEEIRYAIALTS